MAELWAKTSMAELWSMMIAKYSKINPKIVHQYIYQQSKPRDSLAHFHKVDGSLTKTDLEKDDVLNGMSIRLFVDDSLLDRIIKCDASLPKGP